MELERELRDAQKDARVYSSQAKVLQAGGADATVATRKANEAKEEIQRLRYELDIQHFVKKIPTVNDKIVKDSIDKALEALKSNPQITRNELTQLFPKKTKVGVNPVTKKPVYVYDKDMSYFLLEHVAKDGSLSKNDFTKIASIFDYDILAKNFDKTGVETGPILSKKRKIGRDITMVL